MFTFDDQPLGVLLSAAYPGAAVQFDGSCQVVGTAVANDARGGHSGAQFARVNIPPCASLDPFMDIEPTNAQAQVMVWVRCSGPADVTLTVSTESAFRASSAPCPADSWTVLRDASPTGAPDIVFAEVRADTSVQLDVDDVAVSTTLQPDTEITAAPPNPTGDTAGQFSFIASEAASTFTCRLDANPPQPCMSPYAFAGLAAGAHAFSVSATDSYGAEDTTPALYAWNITTAPPGNPTATGSDSSSTSGSASGGPTSLASIVGSAVHGRKRLRVRVKDNWTWTTAPSETRLRELLLTSVPRATIRVTCRGAGCAARRLTQTGVSRLDVARRFGARALKPGATLDVRVWRKGWIGLRLAYRIRSERAPKAKARCLSPATSRTVKCSALRRR